MNFLELVKNRYSVRSFQERSVEPEKLEYLLECARLAPSACNRQPWRYIVVRDKARREALCGAAARFEWMQTAPLFVVICTNDSEAWVRSSDGRNHSDVDAAITTEHLCLAAVEQGLGTCWICAFNVEKCRQALDLDPALRPVVILPIGYPAVEPHRKVRKELAEIKTEK
ncbi:MAG: nitroreductase [Rikenellaceae bacterium]|nr:nitroreductase [Rikenellaceae bacterium]